MRYFVPCGACGSEYSDCGHRDPDLVVWWRERDPNVSLRQEIGGTMRPKKSRVRKAVIWAEDRIDWLRRRIDQDEVSEAKAAYLRQEIGALEALLECAAALESGR